MKNSTLTFTTFDAGSYYPFGVEKSPLLTLKEDRIPTDLVDESNRVLRKMLIPLGCLRNHEHWTGYLDCASPSVLKALPTAIEFLHDLKIKNIPIDLDKLDRVLRLVCKLNVRRENHQNQAKHLDFDDSVPKNYPDVIDFLHDLCFDINEYLATTPLSHEWLREHGHGD
jgi:hypothetical protein